MFVFKVKGKVGFKIDFTTSANLKRRLDDTIASGLPSQRARELSIARKYTTTPAPTQERINNILQALHATGT